MKWSKLKYESENYWLINKTLKMYAILILLINILCIKTHLRKKNTIPSNSIAKYKYFNKRIWNIHSLFINVHSVHLIKNDFIKIKWQL